MSEQQLRTSDEILALRVRNEVLEAGARHWNGVYKIILDERDALRARVAKLDRISYDFWRQERERILSKPFDEYREDIEAGNYLAAIDIILETAK